MLFGGESSDGSILGDTWEWDGATNLWTELNVVDPPARRGGGMAFDEAHSRAVLFGGAGVVVIDGVTYNGGTMLQDTWEYAPDACGGAVDGGPPPRRRGLASWLGFPLS